MISVGSFSVPVWKYRGLGRQGKARLTMLDSQKNLIIVNRMQLKLKLTSQLEIYFRT